MGDRLDTILAQARRDRCRLDGSALGAFSFKTPVFTTILCGVAGGIVAALVPIDVLGELVSIGTLLAFVSSAPACSCCAARTLTSSDPSGCRTCTSSQASGS